MKTEGRSGWECRVRSVPRVGGSCTEAGSLAPGALKIFQGQTYGVYGVHRQKRNTVDAIRLASLTKNILPLKVGAALPCRPLLLL